MKSKRGLSLQIKILEQCHQEEGLEGEFSQTEKAIRLREQLNALKSNERLFREQAELLCTQRDEEKPRRAFIELFTTSKIGLAIISTGHGSGDTSVQSQFRAECIQCWHDRDCA